MDNLFGDVEDLRDAFLELVSLGRQKSVAMVHQPLSLLRIATSLQCWLLSKELSFWWFRWTSSENVLIARGRCYGAFLEDFDFKV